MGQLWYHDCAGGFHGKQIKQHLVDGYLLLKNYTCQKPSSQKCLGEHHWLKPPIRTWKGLKIVKPNINWNHMKRSTRSNQTNQTAWQWQRDRLRPWLTVGQPKYLGYSWCRPWCGSLWHGAQVMALWLNHQTLYIFGRGWVVIAFDPVSWIVIQSCRMKHSLQAEAEAFVNNWSAGSKFINYLNQSK